MVQFVYLVALEQRCENGLVALQAAAGHQQRVCAQERACWMAGIQAAPCNQQQLKHARQSQPPAH